MPVRLFIVTTIRQSIVQISADNASSAVYAYKFIVCLLVHQLVFTASWRAPKLHRTAASCDWRWLESVIADHSLLNTGSKSCFSRSVWMTCSDYTTSRSTRRSFQLASDRCRRPPCWTSSRLTASSHCRRRWKRHRRCHGNQPRGVYIRCSPIRRSCCRTRPTAIDESNPVALQRVDDNLVNTPRAKTGAVFIFIITLSNAGQF